jgi:hypothetical protein
MAVCFALLVTGGCTMVEKTPLSDPEQLYALTVLGLDHDPEYVVGLPVYVAVTVTPQVEGSYFSLPAAGFLSLGGCIGLHLEPAGEGGRSVRSVPPAPIINPEEPQGDTFDLAEREQRRMLVDLSPLLPSGLEPATYDLRVFYVAPESMAQSQPASVTFRAPTDVERRSLNRLAPDRDRYRSWAEWIEAVPDNPSSLSAQVDPDDPLRFAVVLRYLLHNPIPLEQVDPQILSPLTGLYAPEALALRAELLRARDDKPGLAQMLRQIETQYPGLLWWVRSLRDTDGELEWRRSR